MTAVLVARVRDHGGEEAVAELLARAQSPRSAAYLEDIANWISFEEGTALWRAGAAVTQHPEFARAVGEDTVRRLRGSALAALLRSLGSPQAVYEQVATGATKFSAAATLTAVESGPGYAMIVATPAPGFPRVRDHCAWSVGMLSQPPILFGLPPATVQHERCAAHGAEACEYRVTWAIPEDCTGQVEAGLQAQLEAMRVRLDSMFETASDLIASGDVDEVLARIADRAADEVRAPRHLLAVRLTSDGRLHCLHKGFRDDEVGSVTQRLLSTPLHQLPDSWLVVPVASNRREYGRLLATHDGAASFFPQERELLQVYARYAASALDGAAALREAERRNAHSSALLELARALAAAGTSAEIVSRLVEAVPLVVDCDRVGVYLWDAANRQLHRQAAASPDGGDPTVTAESAFKPTPGGTIEAFLRNPNRDPLLVDEHTGVMGEQFARAGFVATLLVALSSPGQLLGLLAVSVRDRPERLSLKGDLLDRLSGVAAQATTALQNGRLVDVITHQAQHDQLTGLANRHRFTSELRSALRRAREGDEPGALLYVDLDDFKPVNDEYGHETGDELLVTVAQRLRRCTRATDIVARLGGDEFAVLLVAASEEDIERVSERIAAGFREPFGIGEHRIALSVSVGSSRYPRDADDADGLLRCADAAMFADKRAHKHRRRDVQGDPAPV
ncbi:MAG: diguanylate cyclase domain-containing protein [Solirubrobacteraceae bacterium]